MTQSAFLLRLALSLLGEVKMFLNHLGRVLGGFLHVGITAVSCLVLKFSQIFFVIFHHHVHVNFIGGPFFAWLFARQFNALFRRDRFQFVVGLAVMGHHCLAE